MMINDVHQGIQKRKARKRVAPAVAPTCAAQGAAGSR